MSDQPKTTVKMLAGARPRGCAKLEAGKEYSLPKPIADRLVEIGKAEAVAAEATKATTKTTRSKKSRSSKPVTEPTAEQQPAAETTEAKPATE